MGREIWRAWWLSEPKSTPTIQHPVRSGLLVLSFGGYVSKSQRDLIDL